MKCAELRVRGPMGCPGPGAVSEFFTLPAPAEAGPETIGKHMVWAIVVAKPY